MPLSERHGMYLCHYKCLFIYTNVIISKPYITWHLFTFKISRSYVSMAVKTSDSIFTDSVKLLCLVVVFKPLL